MRWIAESPDDLVKIAREILAELKRIGKKSVLLDAPMGAGKTTLVTVCMKEMGIEGQASSPTFSIINEYFSVNYGKIYHFDFYRLDDESEAFDLGIEEIFEEDAYLFIEWPEKIENLYPENSVLIKITLEGQNRIIQLSDYD